MGENFDQTRLKGNHWIYNTVKSTMKQGLDISLWENIKLWKALYPTITYSSQTGSSNKEIRNNIYHIDTVNPIYWCILHNRIIYESVKIWTACDPYYREDLL